MWSRLRKLLVGRAGPGTSSKHRGGGSLGMSTLICPQREISCVILFLEYASATYHTELL